MRTPRRRAKKKTVIIKSPTARERRKMGYRNECDICHVKIGTKQRGKKVEIWSFTVEGARGKIFNRCRRHLGRPCR